MKRHTRDAYAEALVELGRKRPEVVVLDADLSVSTRTARFAEAFPDRFFNCGIAEQNMLGIAAGLAASGKIPFVSTFAVFASMRACEQIRQSIAYPRLKVRVVASHGGITVGADGASHQCTEDAGVMRAIPNMTVVIPADATETAWAVHQIVDIPGPVYMRLGRPAAPVVYPDASRLRWGKVTLLREGSDVALLGTGIMVSRCLEASAILEAEGVEAAVGAVSVLKPLDEESVVALARRCGAVVTAEEHSVIGGLGSAVCECLAERYPVPVRRVGIGDVFGQSGEPDELLAHYGLTPEAIAEAALEVMRRKQS